MCGRVLLTLGVLGFATVSIMPIDADRPMRDVPIAPLLRLESQSKTLPPADPGSKVNAVFRLINDGRGPLQLGQVKTSCGCAQPVLTADLIKPGADAELRVEISVPSVGKNAVTIDVTTNDPLAPAVQLLAVVESNAAPPFVLRHSSAVNFIGRLDAGQSRNAQIETWERAGSAPWLQQFESGLDIVTASVTGVDATQGHVDDEFVHRTYRLKLTLSESPKFERQSGRLQAFAEKAGDPAAVIPLLIDPARAVEVFPRTLYVTGAEFPKEYRVFVRAAEAGFALDVEPKQPLPDWVSIESAKSTRHGMRELRLTVSAAPQQTGIGLKKETILLSTNHPDAPVLSLPVLYRRVDLAKASSD